MALPLLYAEIYITLRSLDVGLRQMQFAIYAEQSHQLFGQSGVELDQRVVMVNSLL